MAKRKNFIFTNKKHSDKAIMGAILGIISLASMIIVIFLSYSRSGDVPAGYGFTGLLSAVFSMIGLVLGVMSLRERERFHFFSWLGAILNVVTLLVIGVLLYAGF